MNASLGGLGPLLTSLAAGTVYDLEHVRRVGDPIHPAQWPGYVYALHRRHEASSERRTGASALVTMAEHSGTHIDALCHQAEDLKLFGGVPVTPKLQTPQGFTQLGVDAIAPILRRGVLIDLAASRGAPVALGEEIQVEELESTAAEQGVVVGEGDVALVRTGNGARWKDSTDYLAGGGMSRTVSEWMAARRVFAVGADLVAWDLPGPVDPVVGSSLPGHVILLVRSGIHILENLDLERLGSDSVREFLFVCLPLKFSGGTGSPVRPVALVPGEAMAERK